ncbi:MAG: exodeoxyribonuclease VII small subunit [Sulfurovum sp.]|jgi:exodeoxyribonuclease VII small subunit|nr:MAG: Exodeoxyribonuclease 7 small subunit [Arcobacter lacus]
MSEETKNLEEKLVFEDKIKNAKEILERLSNPDITLTDSMENYKAGIKELEDAQKLLDEAKLVFNVENK